MERRHGNMNKFELKSSLIPQGDQPKVIKLITDNFKAGQKFQTLLGVTGSGKTFTVANIIQNLNIPVIVLAHNKTLAAQLYAEFREFFPNNAVEYFISYYDYYRPEAYVPNTDTYIEKDSAINDEIDKLRHATTRGLMERKDVIVVASVSCIYGIGSPEDYKENAITLSVGDSLDRDLFLRTLVAIQYTRNDVDFSRGNFRVRGDLVEIFPPSESSDVIRIEFFGDEIENIQWVDSLRGVTLKKLNQMTLYPSNHYVVGEARLKASLQTIRTELRERLQELEAQGKLLEMQRLQQRTLYDLEMLEEVGFCSGVENYSRHLTMKKPGEPPPTLIDFFDGDFLLVVDESHMTIPQVGAMYKGDRSRKETLVNYGFRLPSALDNRPLRFEEFESKIKKALFVSATPAKYEMTLTEGEYAEQVIRPTGLLDPIVEVKDAEHQVDDLLEEVKKTVAQGFRVLITTLTKKLAEEVARYYHGLGIKIRYLHSDITTLERLDIIKELRQGVIDVLVGINLLREGLDLPEVSLVAILDADKEGFLRSTPALIQTIGRAARNAQGRVILYGYKVSPAMKQAMEETKRRRAIQEKYNQKHGITPKTIEKKILGGIMDVLQMDRQKALKVANKKKNSLLTQAELKTPQEIEKMVEQLQMKMKAAAKALEFETAAELRDQIKKLNELRLLL